MPRARAPPVRTASWRRSPSAFPPKTFATWLPTCRECADMRMRWTLIVGLTLLLAACGKQESADQGSPARPPAAVRAPQIAPAAPPPTADQQKAPAPAQAESSKITITNEDGTETV